MPPDRLRATMKKFVAILLCASLSIFTMARAMKPGHNLAAVAKTAQKNQQVKRPMPRSCSMTQTSR